MTYVQTLFTADNLRTKTLGGMAEAAAMEAKASLPPAHVEVAACRYENLDVTLETDTRTFWCRMRPVGRPSFTHELMRDISEMQFAIKRLFDARRHEAERPFQYFVMASAIPGIFNLGGDLGHFGELIRAGDLDALKHYGHVAVEAIHRNYHAFDVPVVTMALVQGDALGGGFECALSYDMIVAERGAKLGLPEILFNMFPGMGAYSFLSRRMDRVRAEKLILSGRVYTAEELHEMGVVDILADDGEGEEAVRDYIERHARKHNAHYFTYQARRRVNPVTLDELRDVVDLWAEAAVNLTEPDLRKMARLTAAQDRRRAAATATCASARAADSRRGFNPASRSDAQSEPRVPAHRAVRAGAGRGNRRADDRRAGARGGRQNPAFDSAARSGSRRCRAAMGVSADAAERRAGADRDDSHGAVHAAAG